MVSFTNVWYIVQSAQFYLGRWKSGRMAALSEDPIFCQQKIVSDLLPNSVLIE